MKTNIVCNFAVVRFRPYPETEEFVNIGVVMACPQVAFFDFRVETKRRERVTHFFPELKADLFVYGRRDFVRELKRVADVFKCNDQPGQKCLPFNTTDMIHLFKELVRPRETIFQFGPIATVMTQDPRQKLQELFDYYVDRQFATQEEYREAIMTRRLTRELTAHEIIAKYHERQFGDDLYHVKIPFVYEEGARALRAIKPLDLEKAEPTRIIEYGDKWRMRIDRLRGMDDFPEQMLFVVHEPAQGKRHAAAKKVRDDLVKQGVHVVNERDKAPVLKFAQAV